MGSVPIFLLVLALVAGPAFGEPAGYRVVSDPAESAQPAALQMLRHLAAGELEAAAAMSNAPQRRLKVLQDYRDAVGEEEFRRIYALHLAPSNRVVLEAAIGRHRLLVWELGAAEHRLSGQYFVEDADRFILDDVPSATRRELERVLQALRRAPRG